MDPNKLGAAKRLAPKTSTERARKSKLLHPEKPNEDPEKAKERSRRNRQKKLEHDAAMEQQLADALSRLHIHNQESVAKDAIIDQLAREAAAKDSAIEQLEQELAAMECQLTDARTAALDIDLVAATSQDNQTLVRI
jgi:hypothetical protein